jgi:hypothetical protein
MTGERNLVPIAEFPRFMVVTQQMLVRVLEKHKELGRPLTELEVAEVMCDTLPMKTETPQ